MSIKKYIEQFFIELEIYEDIENGNVYKETICNSINNFLDKKTEKSAYSVYKSFFEAYWIGIQEETNPFLELTLIMKNFEEKGGKLLEKHRDHYIHSVFVFLLGLSIYIKNPNYMKNFNKYALNKNYHDFYKTKHEEFFYRWGLASLSHDIAYPLEIIVQQSNEYMKFVCGYCSSDENLGISVQISTNNDFIALPVLKPKKEFEDEFNLVYGNFIPEYFDDCIKILSYKLSNSFDIKFEEVKTNLDGFVKYMNENGFIDHGYFSAIIMLKWYYHLINKTNWHPAYFYFPVLDSSSSVLLHNYYKRTLMKKPFNLNSMNVSQHPIAYLLILCDELQEWSRKGYGRTNIKQDTPTNFNLFINDSELNIKYEFNEESGFKQLLYDKRENINNILNIKELFKNGIILG